MRRVDPRRGIVPGARKYTLGVRSTIRSRPRNIVTESIVMRDSRTSFGGAPCERHGQHPHGSGGWAAQKAAVRADRRVPYSLEFGSVRTLLRLACCAVPMSLFGFFPAGLASTPNCPGGPTITEEGKAVLVSERQRVLWCKGIDAFTSKNYKLGYELLLPFASSGDSTAKFHVGHLLLRGLLRQSNFFLPHPADAGKGTDIPVDIDLGLRMIKEAATEDEPKAKLLLATLLFTGVGG